MIQERETMQEETTKERGLFSNNKNTMQEETTKDRGLFSSNNIVLFGNSKPNKPCKPFNKPHKMGYNYGGYQAHHGGYQDPHGGYQSQHGYSHAYAYQAQPPVAHPAFGYSYSAAGYSHSGVAHAYPPVGYPVVYPPGPKPHMQNHQQEEYYHHEESTDMYESSADHGYGHGGYGHGGYGGGYGMYREIKNK